MVVKKTMDNFEFWTKVSSKQTRQLLFARSMYYNIAIWVLIEILISEPDSPRIWPVYYHMYIQNCIFPKMWTLALESFWIEDKTAELFCFRHFFIVGPGSDHCGSQEVKAHRPQSACHSGEMSHRCNIAIHICYISNRIQKPCTSVQAMAMAIGYNISGLCELTFSCTSFCKSVVFGARQFLFFGAD